MQPIIRLFFALVLICGSAQAISLRILPWDDEMAERKLSIAHGKKVLEVPHLHPGARSKPVSIPSEPVNLRIQVDDRKDDEGNPLTVKLRTSGYKAPLLLILPDKKSKSGIRALVIEDDLTDFKWGTFRLINVTPKALVFRWGKKAKEVPPGWKPVSVAPGGETRNLETFLYLKSDLKKPLYTSVWEHRDDARQLVFMVPSSNSSLGPVEFKFVPETRIEFQEGQPSETTNPAGT